MKTRATSAQKKTEDELAGCIDKFSPEMDKFIRRRQSFAQGSPHGANGLGHLRRELVDATGEFVFCFLLR